jgi:hypothetical protein
VLRWEDLTKVGALPSGLVFQHDDGTLYRATVITFSNHPAWESATFVVLGDDRHYAAVLTPVPMQEVKDEVASLCERAGVTTGRHRPRTSRPVSHVYSLSSLLRLLDQSCATLEDRGGRALLMVPTGTAASRDLFTLDVRHAMEALAPLLDGHAAGEPVPCAEPKCGKPADTVLFPAFPACARHAVLTMPPEVAPKPARYWEVEGLAITPAGARILGLGVAPDTTTDKTSQRLVGASIGAL